MSDRLFARKEKPSDESQVFNDEEVEKLMNYLWEEQDILGEFLFMDKQGRRIRANRFNHWLHRACIKVGIPERSTHKIRKTYASILLNNQVDDRLVTLQMGHTDIARRVEAIISIGNPKRRIKK